MTGMDSIDHNRFSGSRSRSAKVFRLFNSRWIDARRVLGIEHGRQAISPATKAMNRKTQLVPALDIMGHLGTTFASP